MGGAARRTSADEATALKAAETLNQARGELFKLMVSTRLKTRKLLGDELLQKLAAPPPGEGPLRDNPPGPSERNS